MIVICLLMLGYAAFSAAHVSVCTSVGGSGGEAWLELYRKLGRAGNAAEGVSYLAWGGLMASAYTRARTAKEKAQLRWILADSSSPCRRTSSSTSSPSSSAGPDVRMSLGNLAQLFLSFIPVCTLIGLTRHRVFSLRFFLSRVSSR